MTENEPIRPVVAALLAEADRLDDLAMVLTYPDDVVTARAPAASTRAQVADLIAPPDED